MRGTPGSAYPQPEPNATELPSSAPGRPKLMKLHASAPSPSPTRAEEHIATTLDCRLRALARCRAPKRTSHYTCWCERNTLHCHSHRRDNSTISHCPRRDEAPVPPLLPALVALWSAAIATMCRCDERSVFPGTAALVRAWNLQNAETRVVKPTENPLTFLITATLSPSRHARLTIFKSY